MQLRYYQVDAVNAAYEYFSKNPTKNPCVVLPTGAGKTIVIRKVCEDVQQWQGRVLILAHVKELVEQAAEKLNAVGGLDVGVYAASLKRRDRESDIVVASVQSVYERGFELAGSRPFNLVIVDEAHRIPTEGNGMYVKLLNDLKMTNPKMRILGLTATPFRTSSGYVCSDDHFLNEVCYEADIRELIAGGFLCSLTSKRSKNEAELSGVRIKSGEFVQSEMEQAFLFDNKVNAAVNEIVAATSDRRKVIIFCCGIQHACEVTAMLDGLGHNVRIVTSEHGGRDKAVDEFKNDPSVKFLVNINCLTEGFDAPNIDAVVLLRATCSPGLYYQMVGRGLRPHADKQDCLVLDFGGNIQRHGTIDNLRVPSSSKKTGAEGEAPVKECPECQTMVHAGLCVCSECGHEFPERDPNHEATASEESPLNDTTVKDWPVTNVTYCLHNKKGAGPETPRTMRVTYLDGLGVIADEWICIEHSGFAWEKAFSWWSMRCSEPMPKSVEDAVEIASRGGLAEPTEIKTRRKSSDKFPTIIGYRLGPKPELREPGVDEEIAEPVFSDEEVPF